MTPPPDPPAQQRQFHTRRGVQRTSKADREAFALTEERRQADAQREAVRTATVAATRGTGSHTLRGRGALPGSPSERTRNESGAGVFGAAVPALGVGFGRGRGASRGRGRGVNNEGLVGVKEEVPVAGVATSAGGDAERGGNSGQPEADADKANAPIGDGEKRSTKNRARPTAQRKRTAKATKKDEPVVLALGEEDLSEEGERRDIDTIEISSDDGEDGTLGGNDDDDEGPVSAKARGKRRENQSRAPRAKMALRPVRAPREARETDEFDVLSKGKQIQRSVKGRDKGYGGDNEPRSVLIDDDEMDLDEAGPSMDFSLQVLESQTKATRKKGSSTKEKDPKLVSETIEERAERLRHAEDIRKIRYELSAMSPVVAPTEDVDMTEPDRLDQEMASGREGKIYLFQFPPLTPMLVDPAHKDDVVEIKQEPGAEGSRPDVASDRAAGPGQSLSRGQEKDKEKPTQIKKEDHESKDDIKAKIAAAAEKAKILTAEGARLPPGCAGKLNVHKSGKVTLEWGETNMEVRWGSEVDFLQDVVLAAGDQGEDVKLGKERSVFALGQVQKKLVVIPDWQKIYE